MITISRGEQSKSKQIRPKFHPSRERKGSGLGSTSHCDFEQTNVTMKASFGSALQHAKCTEMEAD
jgi:hypothetical protein